MFGLFSFITCYFFDFYKVETIEEKVKRIMANKRVRAESMARDTLGGFGGDSGRNPDFSVKGMPQIKEQNDEYLDTQMNRDSVKDRNILIASHQA